MTEWQVPGYDAVELLGYGSGGEVWLARDRTTGTPVALKRLRVGADLAARDRLRREAAVLAGVDHPHVVRLRGVVGDGDCLVLVLDLAPGGSLARLLATRRRLAAGEVVTVGVPLAQALAAVHAQGLVHGDVSPANVLFAADGRPLLSDLGVARLLGEGAGPAHGTRGYLDPAVVAGAPPGPASDVHALAAVCLAALTGTPAYDDTGRRCAPPPDLDAPAARLAAALEPALAPDPRDRPTAEALAVAVYDAAPAVPVRFDRPPGALPVTARPAADVATATHQVRPAPQPLAEPAARSRRPVPGVAAAAGALRTGGKGALAAGAACVAVLLAVVAGVAWAGAGHETTAGGVPGATGSTSPARATPPAATPAATGQATARPAADRWAGTLARLDHHRAAAFAAADPAALDAVYAAGSPARQRDRRVLVQLADAGLRASGLRLAATRVAVAGRSGDRVRLAVTDVMPAYRLVDAGGSVVETRPGRGPRRWTVVLARGAGEWRVYDVVRG